MNKFIYKYSLQFVNHATIFTCLSKDKKYFILICMESFELINKDRMKHGYIKTQFRAYKKHCNKMKRFYTKENNQLALLYSLESNFAKFKLFGSLAFLYKNLRLLKFKESDFFLIYKSYINCVIASYKKKTDMTTLIDLRNKLADFYAFIEDIYNMADNRHDFDQYHR